MRFVYPFFGLLLIPVIYIYYKKFVKDEDEVFVNFPGIENIDIKDSFLDYKKFYVIELIIFLLLIITLMRPQLGKKEVEHKIRGYSVMLIMDISSSMKAADLKPNRFNIAKKVIKNFVKKRKNDFIGFTVFARNSLTLVPVTINHDMVLTTIDNLEMGLLQDGTAIGMGISSAISSIKNSKSKAKLLILLTDGNNNSGDISPEKAADIAKEYGLKLYTIGIGSKDMVPFPVDTPFGKKYKRVNMEFNEEILKNISQKTGGKYYRATNNKELKKIYNDINKLEKSKFKLKYKIKYKDIFYYPLMAAFIILIITFTIKKYFFRLD